MRSWFALALVLTLAAPSAFADDAAPPAAPPVRRRPIEPRKFEAGKLTDPYWGVTYTTAGLEEKPGERLTGRLLDGKTGRVQIEIGIWEFADELGARERRDAAKKTWDEKRRAMKDYAQGDDPAPWATFEEEAPSGAMRRHGFSWYVRGCRVFQVHAHVASDAEGGADAVRATLFGLVVGPETGAALAVQTISKQREMPYDDAGVLASAAEQYLRPDFNGVTRPAIAEDLLKRALANLAGSPLERSALGVMKVWENLVVAENLLKKYDDAIAAGVKCVEQAGRTEAPGPDTANANYNLACSYSLAGKLDDAFATLAKSFEKFPPVPREHLLKDPDLERCRADPRWAKFLETCGAK